jgi:hypothetical protein
MNGNALVLTPLNEVRVTGRPRSNQSTMLVVNQIVPETGRQPFFYRSPFLTKTGVNPKDVVSWIKAKVDMSEIQKEELQGDTHQPPVQAQCIAKQHMAQTLFFGLGLACGDT